MFGDIPAQDASVASIEARRRQRGSRGQLSDRYSIVTSGPTGFDGSMEIVDRHTGQTLFDWSGPGMVELRSRHPVLKACSTNRELRCSKAFVRRLALSKTAIDLARSKPVANRGAEPSSVRVCRPDPACGYLALLLRSRPGVHYTLDDVCSLLALKGHCPEARSVLALLEKLCRQGQLQRIAAAPGRVFYDCDTRPHLHIYDPDRNELCDAPATGVISRVVSV